MAHQLFLLLLVVPASLSLPASKLPVLFQHSGPSHNVSVFRGANVELARQAGLLPSLPTIGLAREGKSDDGSSDDSGADFSAGTGAADTGANSGGNSGADIIDFGSDSGSGLDVGCQVQLGVCRVGRLHQQQLWPQGEPGWRPCRGRLLRGRLWRIRARGGVCWRGPVPTRTSTIPRLGREQGKQVGAKRTVVSELKHQL